MLDALLDLVSASPWTYVFVFAIAALDAVLPIVPAETAVIAAGVLAAGGELQIAARFIPGGRTATTLTAGLTHMSWRRFVAYDLLAAAIWAGYAALLGLIGGRAFEDEPLTAILVALGAALALSGVYETIRAIRRRGRQPRGPGARAATQPARGTA